MYYLISSVIILLCTFIVYSAWKRKNYFKQWGIPTPTESCLTGSSPLIYRRHPAYIYRDIYNVNEDAKYVGCHIFGQPIIVLRDLDLIKAVMVKSFDNFAFKKSFVNDDVDPIFGKNLIFLNGEKWHEVRSLLSPAFTSSKMRAMFVLMSNCAENFVNKAIDVHKDESNIDVKDLFGKYSIDAIATCAFGLEINSMEDADNEFYNRSKNLVKFGYATFVKFVVMRAFPSIARILNLRIISKEDTDYFVNVIESTIKARDENGISRPDMLQLMMDARGKAKNLDSMEMAAQAFVFFLGGLETTTNQMSMIAHELATNPDVQMKLQAEVDEVMRKSNGKPNYEAISDMPYLDAVISENLRMHSLPALNRMCSKTFELPPTLPGSKPYLMKEGAEVHIPVAGLHHDPKYYENPTKFDPDRFMAMNKKSTSSEVTSLGFGLGPRMCIGNRFAVMEAKIFLVHILRKCSFEVCEKTCLPLVYNKNMFTPTPNGGAWLNIKTRS